MIICAAVIFELEKDHKRVTVCGVRHSDCYQQMVDLGFSYKDFDEIIQGFVDDKGQFYDRIEAFNHARDCHQLSPSLHQYKISEKDFQLFSEDLY